MRMMGADSVEHHRATVLGAPTTTPAWPWSTTPLGVRRPWRGEAQERNGSVFLVP